MEHASVLLAENFQFFNFQSVFIVSAFIRVRVLKCRERELWDCCREAEFACNFGLGTLWAVDQVSCIQNSKFPPEIGQCLCLHVQCLSKLRGKLMMFDRLPRCQCSPRTFSPAQAHLRLN